MKKMKRILFYSFFVVTLLLNNYGVWAENAKSLGIGITLGDPTGPTLKYWLSEHNAFDIGIGFQKDTIIYADYLWHSWDIFDEIAQGVLGGYVGLGARIQEKKKDDKIGIRSTVGIDYFFEKHPIELFLELAPVFQVSPDTDTEFDIFFGVRFYLNKKK